MNFDAKSKAGPRQFEQTAIAKLVASGVPRHIADVFVKIGLPKSGRTQEIKDHVCKMEYKPFFIERTLKDYQDPLRVGAYVPYVYETRPSRFFCEFQMTDIESARFAKQFPEYDIVARGKTTNQHAFYANKRYAECELLIDMVHLDAKKTGFEPTSVIDLGGNDAYHAKRGRDTIHCDNPVLSMRDIMRYRVREIMSGSDRDDVCRKTFQQCEHSADYAIAVHATYDVTPKTLAQAMSRRRVKKFFGVINFIPGIETKPPGFYEVDGVTMTLFKDHRKPSYVECGFRHDPSLKYRHELRVLEKYLFNARRYDVVAGDGETEHYLYEIRSVRGNSIIFSISKVSGYGFVNQSVWSVPAKRSYFISLHSLGVTELEVDAELFDRLVLQASGARNIQDYDIVSLFRYGKSLRQRVSLNGVVLSSGFMYRTEELVYAVIAAYGTAAAFRVESGDFFSKASSQIISSRRRGFLRDTFTIVGKVFLETILTLPKALAYVTGIAALDKKLSELIAGRQAIGVSVFKPHAGRGMAYDSTLLTKRLTVERVKQHIDRGVKPSLRSLFYSARSAPMDVEIEGKRRTLMSKGMVPYDSNEIPKSTGRVTMFKLDEFHRKDMESVDWVEDARNFYYQQAMRRVRGGKLDSSFSVMANGDRIVRHGTTDVGGHREFGRQDMSFVGNRQQFAVLRGVGPNVINLEPPEMYKTRQCIGFYLFFEGMLTTRRTGAVVHDTIVDLSTNTTYNELDHQVETVDDAWSAVGSGSTQVEMKVFSSASSADQFMATTEAEQGYFMSGALPDMGVLTPPEDQLDTLVTDYVSKVATIPVVYEDESPGESQDPIEQAADAIKLYSPHQRVGVEEDPVQTVDSDEVVPGRRAMEELLYIIDETTRVALATAANLINFATAVSNGDASIHRFMATAQGHPGNMLAVRVKDDGGEFLDLATGKPIEHMAVSDGVQVFDRITRPPPPGIYVTGDSLMIYTGAAIKRSIVEVLTDRATCEVICVDGVAGSGKSYYIEHTAVPGDVVLCETRASLEDLADGLMKKVSGWQGAVYTIDSFLLHRQVKTAATLWIDESFRLHAGKIYAIVKLLKPNRVMCFGDSKQIPALPFIPKYDFVFHEFPFTSIQVKTDSWRCPADVMFVLSTSQYYNAHVTTHNSILRSLSGPLRYTEGMFHGKSPGHALLVYERELAHDLRSAGVKNVYTIGESQGKTFDHVMLYRSNSNGKQIYYDKFQALVALTRHRMTFTYVTVCSVTTDDSAVAGCIAYFRTKANEVLLASHLCSGVRGVADYNAYRTAGDAVPPETPYVGVGDDSDADAFSDLGLEVASRRSDWADITEEEFSLFD